MSGGAEHEHKDGAFWEELQKSAHGKARLRSSTRARNASAHRSAPLLLCQGDIEIIMEAEEQVFEKKAKAVVVPPKKETWGPWDEDLPIITEARPASSPAGGRKSVCT